MAKNKLTKGSLSLGQIEKEAMPEIKSGLKENVKRTTLYLDENLYRAIKRHAVMEDITIKDYINNVLRKDCEQKGILYVLWSINMKSTASFNIKIERKIKIERLAMEVSLKIGRPVKWTEVMNVLVDHFAKEAVKLIEKNEKL